MVKFCRSCGTQITESSKFCATCGTPLETGATAPPEAPGQMHRPYYQPPTAQPGHQQPTAQPGYQHPTAQPGYQQAQPVAAPKKQKGKKGCLVAVGCVAGFILIAIVVAIFVLGNVADKDYYDLGKDKIPSVKLVVEKRALAKMEKVTSDGVTTLTLAYKDIEDPEGDLVKYLFHLRDKEGFAFTKDYMAGANSGSTQMAKESVDNGYIIILDVEYYKDGYTLVFTKSEGTFTLYGTKNEDISVLPISESVTPEPDGEPDPVPYPENQTIFDFSVLSEKDFPRGAWTIDQLKGRYGTPSEINAYYMPDYDIAFANVYFDDFSVHFFPRAAEEFSFYREGLEEENYLLDKEDDNIHLEILSLVFEDESMRFPYKIKIGSSTKAQVLAAYPIEPPFTWEDDEDGSELVSYSYGFPDESGDIPDDGANGSVDYLFNEKGVLIKVFIDWYYFDL